MGQPLHHFLKDFSEPAQFQAPPHPGGTPAATDMNNVIDNTFALRRAYERGRSDGVREESERGQVEHQRLVEQHRLELEKVSHEFACELATRIVASLDEKFEDLRQSVARHAAAALQPIVNEVAGTRAVHDLAQEITTYLQPGRSLKLRITGPAELLDMLQQLLAELSVSQETDWITGTEFVPNHEPEILVLADMFALKTELADWQNKVEAVVRA